MIVAVERGFSALKRKLEQNGYSVVYADEYSHPADAYIFSGKEGSSLSMLSGIGEECVTANGFYGFTTPYGGRQRGVIEINASEKSFIEIERELNIRRQTDYF